MKEKNIILLLISNFLNVFGVYLFLLSAFLFLSSAGKEAASQLSLFLLIYSLPKILFSYWIGKQIEKYSRKKLLLLSQVLFSGFIFCFISREIRLWLILAFVFSILNQVYRLTMFSYLPSLLSKEQISKLNSYLFFGEAAGMLVASFVSGRIGSYPLLVYCCLHAFIYAISSLFLCFVREKQEEKKERKEEEREGFWRHPKRALQEIYLLWNYRKNKALLSFQGILTLILGMEEVIFLIFLVEVAGYKEERMSYFFTAQGLGMVVGSLVGAHLFRKTSFKRNYAYLLFACLCMSLSMLGYIYGYQHFWILYVSILLLGMAVTWMMTLIYSLYQYSNPKKRGEIVGFSTNMEGVLKMLAVAMAPLFLKIATAKQLYYAIIMYFMLLVLAGIFFFISSCKKKKKMYN